MHLYQSLELEHKNLKKIIFFENKKYSFYLEEFDAIVLEKNETFQNPDEAFFIELFFVMKKILVYLKEKSIDCKLFFDKGPTTFKITLSLKTEHNHEDLLTDMQNMFEVNNDPF